jgi:hypothetical protein
VIESMPHLTTHSTRAQIELFSCARPSSYYGLLRRVNSGVGRLPFIKKEIAIYGSDDRMRVSLSRR